MSDDQTTLHVYKDDMGKLRTVQTMSEARKRMAYIGAGISLGGKPHAIRQAEIFRYIFAAYEMAVNAGIVPSVMDSHLAGVGE